MSKVNDDAINDSKKKGNDKPTTAKNDEEKFSENTSDSSKSNLTEINTEPKPLHRGSKLEYTIRHLITGGIFREMPFNMPNRPLPIKCFIEKGSKGHRRIVQFDHKKKLVIELTKTELTSIIDEYVGHCLWNEMNQSYSFLTEKIESLTNKFIRRSHLLDEWPNPIGFATSDGYFFERHEFDPVCGADYEQFPIIFSFLKRTENFVSLCQIIGSILDGKPIRKLSPLLWGAQGSGKSTFFMIIRKLLGDIASKDVPTNFGSGKDLFAMTFLCNSAAWFADEAKAEMINSNEFKKVTGSATYPVRSIGKDYVDVRLSGVFFLNANPRELDGIKNDSSILWERILSCRVDQMDPGGKIHGQEKVIDLAEKELKYFAGYCLDVFRNNGNEVIRDEKSYLVTEVVEESETDLEAIFNRYLVINVKHSGTRTSIFKEEWQHLWETICNQNFQFSKTIKRKDFNGFVARKLGREKHMIACRTNDGNKKGVPGLELRKIPLYP